MDTTDPNPAARKPTVVRATADAIDQGSAGRPLPATGASAGEKPVKGKRALIDASVVIVVGVLATTLSQTSVLPRLPFQNLLKNALHVDRAANAAFFFWVGLAWYFKPFAGVVTDAFPLFGSRRRSYLLISTTLAVLGWVALYFTPRQYNALLWVSIVINVFMVVASTVVGGYMVEVAQEYSGSGRLTALRNFVQQACYIITGPTAGFLGSIAIGWTIGVGGGVMFLLVPATIFFLHEQRRNTSSKELLHAAGKQMVKIGHAGTMWAAAGLMALFYIAPGLFTATFYKEQNDLHMNTNQQGFLVLLQGVFGVLAAVGYGYACRKWSLRVLLPLGLAAGTISNLLFLFYTSVFRAQLVNAYYGLGFTFAELVMMDLAVRTTPKGSEGLAFSLMMSVRNLALYGTDWFGSVLLDRYHWTFNGLVLSNAATSAITIPLVFLLPLVLLRQKDEDPPEDVPTLRAAIQE